MNVQYIHAYCGGKVDTETIDGHERCVCQRCHAQIDDPSFRQINETDSELTYEVFLSEEDLTKGISADRLKEISQQE